MCRFTLRLMLIFDEAEKTKHRRKRPPVDRRRSRGEGSVFSVPVTLKSGEVVTYYRATKQITIDGVKKRVSRQARTREDAIQRRDFEVMRLMVDAGLEDPENLPRDPANESLTVADCMADWMDERKRGGKLTTNSLKMYDSRIRGHILPVFGTRIARTLKSRELLEYFTETMPAKGWSASTIRQTRQAMVAALGAYVRDGHLRANPMDQVPAPAAKKKNHLERAEIRLASETIAKHLLPTARELGQEARWFLALMGLRQSEALGLTDEALIPERRRGDGNRIRVFRQLQRVNASHGCLMNGGTGEWACGRSSTLCPKRIGEPHWKLSPPKSENGLREIVVDEESWHMLLDHRDAQRERRKSESFKPEKGTGLDSLLFTRVDGGPIYGQRDRKALTALVESFPERPEGMTVHTLRHMATTMLLDGGVERDVLVSMMGWSPKNADAQIATYSSADNAKRAAGTTTKHSSALYDRKPAGPIRIWPPRPPRE